MKKIFNNIKKNHIFLLSTIIIILIIILTILLPYFSRYKYDEINTSIRLTSPTFIHIFGTDELGRDYFIRIVNATKISLFIGITSSLISVALGTIFGIIAGYYNKTISNIIMRIVDVIMSFPTMLLIMIYVFIFGNYLTNIFISIALINWTYIARIIYTETIRIKNEDFIEASEIIGTKKFNILLNHILPNCLATIIMLFTISIPEAILIESTLSFLGFGIQRPSTSLGLLVYDSKQYFYTNPHLCIIPCIVICIIVFIFNIFSNELKKALEK